MADPTTTTLESRLGVQTLPVPVADTPATNDIIKLVYEQILGITPTPEQMARYDGLTIRDLYNDVAQQKEALSQSAPSTELTDLSKYLATQTDPEAVSNINTISLLFNTYVGRSPSAQELQTYSSIDPGMATTLIKDLGKNEAEAKASQPEPVFSGTNYLVMFSDDPTPLEDMTGTDTLWLLNTNNHSVNGVNYSGSLVPFSSEEAINNFFQGKYTLQELKDLGKIVVRPTSALADQNSIFYNARIVKSTDGVKTDGTLPLNEAVKFRYGQPIDVEKESKAKNLLYRVFSDIVDDDPNFSQDYFDNAFNDRNYLSKYINALAYGGYSVADIYMDIMAHNKRVEGDPTFDGYTGLSATHNVSDWKANSPDYTLLREGQNIINLPDMEGYNWDWKALDMPIWDIPEKAYGLAITPKSIDLNDPETIAEIERVQTLLSDVAIQMSEADNRRDIAAAQYNWQQLKDEIEKSLNINLSDNAYDAWSQLEALKSNMSDRGLTNSGVFNRLMDTMLRDRRRADQRMRDASLDQKDQQLRTHLLNNGTVEEIENFINERGLDTAKEWGLIPDDETLEYFDMDNLKEMYPGVSEAELQEIRDIMIGDTSSGQPVYKSTLMRNHLANLRQLKINKFQEQTQIYLDQKAYEEEKAKEQFTSGGPFDTASYPEAAAIQDADSKGAQMENFLNNWRPEKISGEIALKNIFDREIAAGRDPEKAVARTSTKDIYVRNLDAERKMIGQWVAEHGTPQTEAQWKAFRDKVYATRPQTQMEPNRFSQHMVSRSDGSISGDVYYNGKKESFRGTPEEFKEKYPDLGYMEQKPWTNEQKFPHISQFLSSKGTKDYGASSATGAPSSGGFTPKASDSRFWGANPESEENWRKLRSGEITLGY